jgi:transposase
VIVRGSPPGAYTQRRYSTGGRGQPPDRRGDAPGATAYDAAPDGEKGAILRREGLYSSHLVDWRRSRDAGALAGLTQPRGRPGRDPHQEQITRLERENRRLEQELAKARFVVDVQAKLHALLETISESADTDPESMP